MARGRRYENFRAAVLVAILVVELGTTLLVERLAGAR